MSDRLGAGGIVEDGAVYISGKQIVEIGPYKDLRSVYPTATVIGSSRFWVALDLLMRTSMERV
jgi:cytosine/adenosine deaminase-related metal-dependent hydrolase